MVRNMKVTEVSPICDSVVVVIDNGLHSVALACCYLDLQTRKKTEHVIDATPHINGDTFLL